MEDEEFPVFQRRMNERRGNDEEDTVNEDRTTGQESRTRSETHLDGGQDRWRDDGDGFLADDEDDEEDDDDEGGNRRIFVFSPLVMIVRKGTEKQTECYDVRGRDVRGRDVRGRDVRGRDVRGRDVRGRDVRGRDVNTLPGPQELNRSRCVCCGEVMSSLLFLAAGVVMFPLLVWGGHVLLPITLPVVRSAPSRLVYTLRCALFATFPILLGMLVHGVSHLKFSSPSPLFDGKRGSRHRLVHVTYVQDSLRLFLLFFLQLAVMSTYIDHNTLNLVPLLTIVFVFGRLIYWPSVCFASSVRVLGFSLSFLPVLTLMGLNLYFICSSTGEGAVFDVAPPTTPPPPKARWWWD